MQHFPSNSPIANAGILLKHFEIQNKMQSYHKFNEHKAIAHIIDRLSHTEENIALVSDAGTPGISDPVFRYR